ncbi:hypothetical protein GNP73_08285 [Aliivibrio fischeri]|uniref:hypothetical protein n=1 Tax=Aliivibrio fischeri TaxID=668 RepID=UPI0012DA4B00|nr:hypothetical protein [Aliivibrio fischeri]MUJ27971.1 hypothetical protein [Aliivibrio fischeri]
MELVHIALLDNDTLKRHQKRETAPYEWIVFSPKRLTRYYGNAPLTCYGEKVRDELSKPHNTSVYLEQMGVNSWYSCVMDSDGVLQEKMGSFPLLCDVLAYDLFMAHTIFTANDFPTDIEGREEQDQHRVPAIIKNAEDAEDFEAYRLKKAQKNRIPLLLTMGLLVLTVGGSMALLTQAPPTPTVTVQKSDPFTQWQKEYQHSLQVGNALLNAQNLLVMAYLLPTGSSANTLTLRDGKLTLPVHNEPTINPSLWQQWLADNPSFSTHYDAKSHDVSVALSSQGHQPSDYNKETKKDMMQRLHYLGFGITLKEQRTPTKGVLVSQYQLTNTLPLAILDVVSEVLNNPLASIDELSLSLNDDVTVTINMGITLQGTTL